mmetsp:Transcript_66431/g.192510  ORF Transcript_66431/g.192510 Transcript_66431/m.192510 type:complete len:237 (+) Transcript_66431:2-712(+)
MNVRGQVSLPNPNLARMRANMTAHPPQFRGASDDMQNGQPTTDRGQAIAQTPRSMERLELVRLNRRLVFVQVGQRILCAVMVRIVVRVDGLRLEPGDGIELLDRRRAEAGQGAEHGALDLGDLGVLHGIHEGILRLRRVVLELFGGVLFAEWCDLVEIHLEIVRHLLRQVVLRRLLRGLRRLLRDDSGVGRPDQGGGADELLQEGGHGCNVERTGGAGNTGSGCRQEGGAHQPISA